MSWPENRFQTPLYYNEGEYFTPFPSHQPAPPPFEYSQPLNEMIPMRWTILYILIILLILSNLSRNKNFNTY